MSTKWEPDFHPLLRCEFGHRTAHHPGWRTVGGRDGPRCDAMVKPYNQPAHVGGEGSPCGAEFFEIELFVEDFDRLLALAEDGDA